MVMVSELNQKNTCQTQEDVNKKKFTTLFITTWLAETVQLQWSVNIPWSTSILHPPNHREKLPALQSQLQRK